MALEAAPDINEPSSRDLINTEPWILQMAIQQWT
jgi:hypothetical protein